VAIWPSVLQGDPLQTLVAGDLVEPFRPVEPGSASDALVAAVCTDAPRLRLASSAEVFAYVEAPNEDPAFRALRKNTVYHDQMRWESAPSAQDLETARQNSKVDLTETVETWLFCVVTRDHQLSECEANGAWETPKLHEAHLSLLQNYVPARRSIDGRDTAGRTVESRILWSPSGARVKPLTFAMDSLTWKSSPSPREISRANPSTRPARAEFICEVSPAYRLTKCTVEGITFPGDRISLKMNDLVLDGPESSERRARLAQAVKQHTLPMVLKHQPEPKTTQGEDLAGQFVRLEFEWTQ
jgi:hypothetical protein